VDARDAPAPALSFAEFVALIALMMGVTAFAIDNLLPAFDVLGAVFRVDDPNRLQLLVYGYMIAFAVAQIGYGPLSDMLGRRPVLLVGLAIFTIGSLLALVAPSFEVLLLARVIQGIGTAAARVLAVSIVRDRYSGREMARVMSLTMMVFLIVPVFAPTIGTALLLAGGWRAIFASMLALAVGLAVWFGLRMPETLHPEYRFPLSFARIGQAVRLTVSTRISLGYATAVGLMMGCLMGYIGSAQQILETSV
jgi:MFS transporter, DHA1 family, multidrug resistance protein